MASERAGLTETIGDVPNRADSHRRMRLIIGEVDLEQTLDGGQAFRWHRSDANSYRGVIASEAISLSSVDGDVEMMVASDSDEAVELASVRRYLNADVSADTLRESLGGEPGYGADLYRRPLLRVLRQDAWECLSAFICSQNSNMPRIKQMVASIAATGRRIGGSTHDFEFPQAESVAEIGESGLRSMGLGYRAKHLAQTATMVSTGEIVLHELRRANYRDAKLELMRLPGVGPKVADCVSAYSLDKLEAFPVDVHMRRAVIRLYRLPESIKNDDIGEWARDRFGELASVAQLYMFRNQVNFSRA